MCYPKNCLHLYLFLSLPLLLVYVALTHLWVEIEALQCVDGFRELCEVVMH